MNRSATALAALTALATLALAPAALAAPPDDPRGAPGERPRTPATPPAVEPASTEPTPPAEPAVSTDPSAPDAMSSVDGESPPDAAAGAEPPALAPLPTPPPLEVPPDPALEAAPSTRAVRRLRPVAMTGIRIFAGDGRCLDVHGGQHTTGAPVVLSECHGKADQRWSFTPGGRIRGAGGHCLDVTGRSPSDRVLLPGADVVMARCDGKEDDQTFARTPIGELRVHGDNCLSLDRPAAAPVVRVEVRPCDGAPDQRWFLGAPPVHSAVRVADGDGRCPAGYVPLPADEALASVETLCPQIGQWQIARLADGGSMDGSGYGCGVRTEDERTLGHTLCRPGRGKR